MWYFYFRPTPFACSIIIILPSFFSIFFFTESAIVASEKRKLLLGENAYSQKRSSRHGALTLHLFSSSVVWRVDDLWAVCLTVSPCRLIIFSPWAIRVLHANESLYLFYLLKKWALTLSKEIGTNQNIDSYSCFPINKRKDSTYAVGRKWQQPQQIILISSLVCCLARLTTRLDDDVINQSKERRPVGGAYQCSFRPTFPFFCWHSLINDAACVLARVSLCLYPAISWFRCAPLSANGKCLRLFINAPCYRRLCLFCCVGCCFVFILFFKISFIFLFVLSRLVYCTRDELIT